MTPWEFAWVQDFLRASAGMRLEDDKAYLAEFRLEPLARREGFPSLSAFLAHASAAPRNGLHARLVEAMTTNETSFFRDVHPFEALRDRILPGLIERRRDERRLTVWSAACSSGQEAYSVAMLLADAFAPALAGWTVRVIGTDLSAGMVQRAREGAYTQIEVNRGLPATCLLTHFQKQGLDWRVRPELRRTVEFRELNLLDDWSALPAPDLVLLRNVLIYLSDDVRRTLLRRLRLFLRPDGLLLLGAAETILGPDEAFERVDLGSGSAYRPLPARREPPMMSALEPAIVDISRTVWKCTVGMDVERAGAVPPGDGPEVHATVELQGVPGGVLTLRCPWSLACEAAAAFFGRSPASVREDEARDAVGELANMTGGNLKAMWPGLCGLSRPRTGVGDRAPAPAGALRVPLACGRHAFAVELTTEEPA